MYDEDCIDRLLQSLPDAQRSLRAAEREYVRLRAVVDSAGELALVERLAAARSRLDEIIATLTRAPAERGQAPSSRSAPL